MQEHGVQLSALYLCKDRTVPITTSGKIARRWCRRAYDEDSYQTLYKWKDEWKDGPSEKEDSARDSQPLGGGEQPAEVGFERVAHEELEDAELMARLVEDVANATNFDPADLEAQTDQPLVSLGMDSLGLAQCAEMLKFKYDCPVPDQWMYFETTTLQQVLIAVRNGGVSEEDAESGVPLELGASRGGGGNPLLETCPCLLMCCPQFVLSYNSDRPNSN
mmetsp:Transcript_66992/g.151416  ORF Transcript_66992/g.151416 Transcript_66992/m.151416 type:complete len:219 (-) Transcript_66992:265-921(-)